nr:AraC family transcriptional regulator ligand-binding domain-containing protein [Oceanococcus sp. HetDA_MAG_MS8]
MSVSEFHVSGNVTGVLLDYLQERGCADTDLLAELSRFDARRPLRNAQWWAFLQRIQAQYPQSPIGLDIGARVRLHHLGALGYVLANAPSAGEAWRLFERFQPSLFNGGFAEMRLDGDQLCLEWGNDFGDVGTRLSDHVLMAGTMSVARQLTRMPTLAPQRLEWMGPEPAQRRRFEAFFQCAMDFDCPSLRVWLPPAAIQLALYPPESMRMASMLEGAADEPVLTATDELLRALHQALLAQMQLGHPHIDAVAAKVGMSRRGLQRFLAGYGVSYSSMVDAARKRMACVYLRDRQVSLSEVALLLGFSEQSAFNRAFRRWLDMSPTQYLRQQNAAVRQAA